VSRWQITLPYRSETDPVSSISDAARAAGLDASGREVAREVALHLATEGGARTVGDAISALDRMTPAERRGLLDDVRARCELESTRKVDAREWLASERQRIARLGDQPGPALRISASGAIIEDDPREAERARVEAETRRRRHEQRLAARAHEGAELMDEREAEQARERRELPEGFAP
jgi:hypothetical protein